MTPPQLNGCVARTAPPTQPRRRFTRRRALLETGRRVRGLFVKMAATETLDVIANAGIDFVIVDREHSQLSEQQALALLRHADAIGLPALLRLPALDTGQVNRALEAGACGIQLSMVRSVDQVQQLFAASRYAPAGSRSVALSSPSGGYGAVDLTSYIRGQEDDPPLLVLQIETEECADPLTEILSAGADVAFIGKADLAVAVQHDAARVDARIEEIAAAAEQVGAMLGGAGVNDPRVRFAADGNDIGIFRAACETTLPSPSAAPTVEPRPRSSADGSMTLRSELEALLVDFSYRVDIGRGAAVHELFVEDGVYAFDGDEVQGRDAIREGYVRRAARGPRTARHIVSNVRVEPLDDRRALANSVWTLYADDGEPVLSSSVPALVADIVDRCRRDADGQWVIERRDLHTVFRSPAPLVPPKQI